MGFMVVGILAATSASASITASVNWTATAGLQFEMLGGTIYSEEHSEDLSSAGSSFAQFEQAGVVTPDNAAFRSLATVNTTTSNQTASGLSATMNANFIDDSNDGVNNPRDIYYIYWIVNNDKSMGLRVSFTDLPDSNTNVNVSYYADIVNGYKFLGEINTDTTKPTSVTLEAESQYTICIIIKLSVATPDVSFSGFDANVGLSISKA